MAKDEKDIDRFHPEGERGPYAVRPFDDKRYVFISYPGTTNGPLLRALVRSILRRGVSVWMFDPTSCKLNAGEMKGVRRQVSQIEWEKEALDALDASSWVLLLVGKRTLEKPNQIKEVNRATARNNRFIAARIDDTPYEDMPEGLHGRKKLNLDVTTEDADDIAQRVEEIADEIGAGVLGKDFRPVQKEGKVRSFVSNRRASLAAAVAGVAIAALVFVLTTMSGPAIPVIDNTFDIPTGPRLALVISQTAYSSDGIRPVGKAKEEAATIADALTKLHFTITPKSDLSKDQLEAALSAFHRELSDAGPDAVGFIYYTGHGVQHPDQPNSYMLGTNAELTSAADIETYGVNLTAERDRFAGIGAKGVILVFDACRNIPSLNKDVMGAVYKPALKSFRPIKAVKHTAVVYSTTELEFAREGVYAPALAKQLTMPNMKLEIAFLNAKDAVALGEEGDQMPHAESNLVGLCLSCPIPKAN